VILEERGNARAEARTVRAVRGIPVPAEPIFREPTQQSCRPAKVRGFVLSRTVASARAASKGYVLCLQCGKDVWAPNSVRHREACVGTHQTAAGREARSEEGSTAVPETSSNGSSFVSRLFCDEMLPDSDDFVRQGDGTS
jgi:hypothetical protein